VVQLDSTRVGIYLYKCEEYYCQYQSGQQKNFKSKITITIVNNSVHTDHYVTVCVENEHQRNTPAQHDYFVFVHGPTAEPLS